MDELQRQAYLEAMGVEQYFPRVQLAGALPSPQCEWSELEPEPELAVSTAVTESVEAVQALLDDKPADQLAQRRTSQSTVAKPRRSTPVTAASDIPHFALTIAKSQSGILIIDDGLEIGQDYTEYLRLLQNILVAVGAGQQAIQLDPFVWPMVKNAQIDQSDEAARQTLAVYIDKLVKDISVKYLLVMGECARQYIPADPTLNRIETVSALRMLAEPALKRQAWHDLQPLKQALAELA